MPATQTITQTKTKLSTDDKALTNGIKRRKEKNAIRNPDTSFDYCRETTYDQNKWRPIPWRYFGDTFTMVLSIVMLTSIAPIMLSNILFSNIIMLAISYFYQKVMQRYFSREIEKISNVWYGFWKSIGNHVLYDSRNYSYLPTLTFLTVWCPLLATWAIWYHGNGIQLCWKDVGFIFLYHLVRIGPRYRFFALQHVLLHKEGHEHEGFFKGAFSYLNHWLVSWYIGMMYGHTPYSYSIAHNKIHHVYHNGLDDVHTNLDLDRTKLSSFILYVPRFAFYWMNITPVIHFLRLKEYGYVKKLVIGQLFYYGVFALVVYQFGWLFAFCYYLYPQLESLLFLGGISYMWHLWIDPDYPANPYVNSVTILNGKDNVWNEDFHVEHHFNIKTVHWNDASDHFEQKKDEFARYQGTIFQNCEQGEILFWILSDNWDELANHFVDLNNKMTVEEKKQLLLRRASVTFGYY